MFAVATLKVYENTTKCRFQSKHLDKSDPSEALKTAKLHDNCKLGSLNAAFPC
jgi:hypothetical protein